MKPTLNKNQVATPLIVKREAETRGRTELGWLHSRHTFSFGEYFDPDQMGFRSLCVLNDDIVEAGQGFGTHSHRNAEIFSYVIEGDLKHQDSMGNGSTIKAGDLQYMSAGRGIQHNEFNPSKNHRVHFLQVWLMPKTTGGEPRYAEKTVDKDAQRNILTLLFSGKAHESAIQILQDAEIFFGKLDQDHSVVVELGEDRHAWLHLIKGKVRVLGQTLMEADGAAISNTPRLRSFRRWLLFVVTEEDHLVLSTSSSFNEGKLDASRFLELEPRLRSRKNINSFRPF